MPDSLGLILHLSIASANAAVLLLPFCVRALRALRALCFHVIAKNVVPFFQKPSDGKMDMRVQPREDALCRLRSFNLFRNGAFIALAIARPQLFIHILRSTHFKSAQCLIDCYSYHSRLGLLTFMSNFCDCKMSELSLVPGDGRRLTGYYFVLVNCCDTFKQRTCANRSSRISDDHVLQDVSNCKRVRDSVTNRRTPRIWGVDSRWNTTGRRKMVQESPNEWNGTGDGKLLDLFQAYEHLVYPVT